MYYVPEGGAGGREVTCASWLNHLDTYAQLTCLGLPMLHVCEHSNERSKVLQVLNMVSPNFKALEQKIIHMNTIYHERTLCSCQGTTLQIMHVRELVSLVPVCV